MNDKLNRLKEILVREGVSQKDLAKKLDKNEHTVSNWCINKSQPHLKDLYRVAKILKVDVCELLVSSKN
ncbi:MAG: helix-turn-helix transcriptional regulator [Crocinitomicaceae bacterium]|nr:helix-turn-helix domain-containing protein [Flavobacteriales bacterium]NQZ36001.1 helix-turn-helix transcriptional regulator [Crocinitomicaceae bacterium]